MALTLAVTFDESTGTILLEATSSTDHAYGDYTITRSDANGTTTVRSQEGLGFSAGSLIIRDHEPALGGLVTYTITAASDTATASTSPVTARTWLKFPIMPQLSLELPTLGANYQARYRPADNVYPALDRDDPIVVFGSFGLRSGSFEIACPTHADALTIIAAYRATRIAMLQVPDPAGASMYHTVSGITLQRGERGTARWMVEGEYTEVGRPVGPVLGTLGWSFADVDTTYADFAEVAAEYTTFNALAIGPLA